MTEIYPNLFKQVIPLPDNPLASINNYLILSKGEALMVDTAFNRDLSVKKMQEIIREHQLDLSKLRLFLTHLHSDHTGLAKNFEKAGTKILMGEVDGEYTISTASPDSHYWKQLVEMGHQEGLDGDHLSVEDHPGYRFRPKEPFSYTPTREGEGIDVGDFHFEVCDLKGHTPGQQGLYEPEKKILFCGDHILGNITPNIQYWGPDFGDALGIYFENLRKVYALEVDLLLSSHRALVKDYRARIRALFAHHDRRLREALTALLEEGPITCREVTCRMHWDISARNFDDFPKSQKWFAVGEAEAHLVYLMGQGLAGREERDGVYYYYAKTNALPQRPLASLSFDD